MSSEKDGIKKPQDCSWGFFCVAGTGLEPVTFGLWARRAAYCSIPRCAFEISINLVDYSDQKIESLVDEMENIIDLFESIKKPQNFSWGHWFN